MSYLEINDVIIDILCCCKDIGVCVFHDKVESKETPERGLCSKYSLVCANKDLYTVVAHLGNAEGAMPLASGISGQGERF